MRPATPSCTDPDRTTRRLVRRILGLRVSCGWGTARIAYHLGLNISTVGRVLPAAPARACPSPARPPEPESDAAARRATSTPYPETGPRRHQGARPHRRRRQAQLLDRAAGRKNRHAHQDAARPRRKDVGGGRPNLGYVYVHHAVDDHPPPGLLRDAPGRDQANNRRVHDPGTETLHQPREPSPCGTTARSTGSGSARPTHEPTSWPWSKTSTSGSSTPLPGRSSATCPSARRRPTRAQAAHPGPPGNDEWPEPTIRRFKPFRCPVTPHCRADRI